MLSFLVTSKARRRLVLLLWGKRRADAPQSGSVTTLAAAAGVTFSSAHKELVAMKRLGMVKVRKDGGSDVFYADDSYPHAALLRALVAAEIEPALSKISRADEALVAELRQLGAPLVSDVPVKPLKFHGANKSSLLILVGKGVALARKRPDVAKALPVLLAKQSDALTFANLRALRLPSDDKRALGMLLAVAGDVAKNPRLSTLAETLQDRRVRKTHAFFVGAKKKCGAKARSFPLAEKWGFSMAMDLESFRDLYRKTTGA